MPSLKQLLNKLKSSNGPTSNNQQSFGQAQAPSINSQSPLHYSQVPPASSKIEQMPIQKLLNENVRLRNIFTPTHESLNTLFANKNYIDATIGTLLTRLNTFMDMFKEENLENTRIIIKACVGPDQTKNNFTISLNSISQAYNELQKVDTDLKATPYLNYTRDVINTLFDRLENNPNPMLKEQFSIFNPNDAENQQNTSNPRL